MADLAQQIRDRLHAISAENDDDCTTQCGRSCADDGYDDVAAALLAVLDRHEEDRHRPGQCSNCFNSHGRHKSWPCGDVLAVAKALGIGATDG